MASFDMDFQTLFNKISPRLKRIAGSHKNGSNFLDGDDLYQEMCIHLWNNFRDGVPAGINEAYIVRGCIFHLLNYLRKEREKVTLLSLEEPVGREENSFRDILPDTREPLDRYIDRKMTIDEIRNNGFTQREKEVFSLLLEGYTTRETGNKLGISHVMVVKVKKRLIKKWQRKDKIRVTKRRGDLLI